MSEEIQVLKNEIEQLKNQAIQQSNGIHQLLAQLDAHKGELTDSRTIALQLRTNFHLVQKGYNESVEANKLLQSKLDEANETIKNYEIKSGADIPALKEIKKGK